MDEAAARLSALVDRVADGEDIVIARDGKPVARLVPVGAPPSLAALHGAMRGQIHFAEDFDDLPTDLADPFGAR